MANNLNAQKNVYVASEWKDQIGDYTPITPERMNHIEQGIQSNSEDLKRIGDAWDSASYIETIDILDKMQRKFTVSVKNATGQSAGETTISVDKATISRTPFLIQYNITLHSSIMLQAGDGFSIPNFLPAEYAPPNAINSSGSATVALIGSSRTLYLSVIRNTGVYDDINCYGLGFIKT